MIIELDVYVFNFKYLINNFMKEFMRLYCNIEKLRDNLCIYIVIII